MKFFFYLLEQLTLVTRAIIALNIVNKLELFKLVKFLAINFKDQFLSK